MISKKITAALLACSLSFPIALGDMFVIHNKLPASNEAFIANADYNEVEYITSGDWIYCTQIMGYAGITDYTGNDTSLTIPSEIDGYKITAIQSLKNDNVIEINLPKTIQSISGIECSNLINVNIAEDNPYLTSVNGVAFSKSSVIFPTDTFVSSSETAICLAVYPTGRKNKEYTIPNEIINIGDFSDNVKFINNYAFAGCESLESITISDNVRNMQSSLAVSGCNNLKEFIISSGNKYLAAYNGVLYTKGLKETQIIVPPGIEKCTIPDTVTTLKYSNTFEECKKLKTIYIPNKIDSIWNNVFNECTELTDVYYEGSEKEWAETVNSTGNEPLLNANIHYSPSPYLELFEYERLKDGSLEITKSVSKVTELEIPNEIYGRNVTSVGDGAFRRCSNLTKITVPDSITNIGSNAFSYCTGLTDITILSTDCTIYETEDTISETAIIHGYENSTAQSYAEKYNRTFVSLGEAPTDPTTLKGDANEDGYVTVADATAVLQAIGNADRYALSEQGKINADVDDTPGISGNDALIIQLMELGLA